MSKQDEKEFQEWIDSEEGQALITVFLKAPDIDRVYELKQFMKMSYLRGALYGRDRYINLLELVRKKTIDEWNK